MKNIKNIPTLLEVKENYIKSNEVFKKANNFVINQMCILKSQDGEKYSFRVEDRFDDFDIIVNFNNDSNNNITNTCSCNSAKEWCSHASSALIYILDKYEEDDDSPLYEGDRYTEQEMRKRVLKERTDRAAKEDFDIQFGDNIYGIHKIRTEKRKTYEITIRDFDTYTGYCTCPDFMTNKLGTCKHLIFANEKIKTKYNLVNETSKQLYPFLEIFCDPLSNYNITFFYKGKLDKELKELLEIHFKEHDYIMPENYAEFSLFLDKAKQYKKVLIRPEVTEKIDKYFENQELKKLEKYEKPDFSKINATLYDYQKDGILFSLFKTGNIIADEMGLGKTIQSIGTAVLKKDIFNLKRVLIICPASLKYQWKQEIEKFSYETATIIEGSREKRQELYKNSKSFFIIANYEAVLRDVTVLHNYPPDMIILDEAQRIKNYTTKTSYAIKSIPKKHAIIITGTPIENKLLDLYSIMNFIDKDYLAPLWEFSMNYCYFDKTKKNKIKGYFNLQDLKDKLSSIIIRREKKDVLKQLPEVQEMIVPIELSEKQLQMHHGFLCALQPLLKKKYKTIYDMQRIFQLLTSMRMVCNSTYLIDKETNISPKLTELEEILTQKLQVKKNKRKLLIFSEWKTMLGLIEKVLIKNEINFVKLSGDIPVKNRGVLIDEFNNNPDILVFLSTEAGGTGLNLQSADTVINFELPWNPAKKNQRIGRIHRIGQKSSHLIVINLVALDCIEEKIANGIVLKESLFNAVLNEGNLTDEVDFTKKGRSTLIEQIENIVSPLAEEKSIIEPVEDEEIFELPEYNTDDAQEVFFIEEEQEELVPDIKTDKSNPVKDKVKAEQKNTENKESESDNKTKTQTKHKEFEKTLNHGMQFLGSLFQMATGKNLETNEQSITVDKVTGEVIMKFKLPEF